MKTTQSRAVGKRNASARSSSGIDTSLRLNALSALLAVVLPALASQAYAQSCASGQTLPGSPANAGCAANVTSGSTLSATTINSGGKQTVAAGGATTATVINSGGTQTVFGTDTSATINNGGKQFVSSGGATISATINSGGTQTVFGTDTSASVNNGGKQLVSAGGVALSATVNSGGSQSVNGIVSAATINNGGKQAVLSGGSAIGTIIASGGSQAISAGGADFNAVINGGGKQAVSSGGVATSAMVMSGGSQSVSAGAVANGTVVNGGVQAVASGGMATSTVVNAGSQAVSAGGSASGTIVNSGGVQVAAGGVVSDTVVNSGGSASVASGGTALNTTVNAFARQTVTSGLAVNTVLVGAVSSGGTQYVSAGGSALNTSVGQKARQTVYAGGVASGTQVLSGGSQTVSSGGQSFAANIANGGSQFVIGGGTATGTTVAAGASTTLYVGGDTTSGTLAGPVFTSGNVQGTLVLATTSALAVTGNANASANALVLNGGNVVFNAPDSAGYKTFVIDGLSGSGGFTLNTQIGSGQTDKLVVNNGTGNYTLNIQDSSTTTPKGARVLVVGGTNDSATFTLPNGTFDVGAEKFALQSVDGQYYIYDTGLLGDAASVAQAVPGVATMLWYRQMEQTSSRFAELRDGADQGLWVRAYGQRMTLESVGVESTSNVFGAQFGRDLRFARPYGNWYLGLTGGVAQARTTAGNSGTANVYPFNVGLYGGLVGKDGWFTDASAGYLGQSNSLYVTGVGNTNNASYNGNGFSVTLEGGRRMNFAGGWTIEPHAGIDYLRANSNSYVFDSGTPVDLAAHGATIATVGATLSKAVTFGHTNLQPYFSLNGMHAFNNEQTVTVAGMPINSQTPSNWGVANLGVSGSLNQSARLALNVSYAKGQQHYQSPVAVTLGFSYRK